MASETSELTFVRCQTCRSLVPASASRCRICNAALEAGGKAADGGTPSAGRVRQKTVSASPGEVAGMLAQSAPAETPPPAVPPARTGSSAKNDEFDPLGAYLQDLDSEPEMTEPPAARSVEPRDDMIDLDDDDFDLDAFDDDDDFNAQVRAEVVESPPVKETPPPPAPPRQSAPPRDVPSPRPAAAPPARSEQAARAPQQFSAPKQEAKPPREERPVAREAAQPPRGNQGGLRPKMGGSPTQPRQEQRGGQPKQERIAAPPPRQERDRDASKPKQFVPNRGSAPSGQRPPQAQSASRTDSHSQDPRSSNDERRDRDVAPPRPGKIHPGRLAGWLVSYENPDGRAIELRSGRFFVTDTEIRGSDLIIEDQSISTPHALLSITDKGLMIQDLMSERGTFVRSDGDSQYRREDGIIEVRHGDWIRFGDVEFLVTLVPMGRF